MRFHEYGGRDKLVVESVPDPVAGPGEVLVKVGACALNHLDVDFREGISRFPLELPLIMGIELAGTITSVGPGVSEQWKVGDRVAPYLMGTDPASVFTRTGRENLAPVSFIGSSVPGGYAEYAAIPERHLVRTPDSMTDVEAAAFQIAFGTSYHMLFTRGELKMGDGADQLRRLGHRPGRRPAREARRRYVIGNASSDEKLAKARELGITRASTTPRRTSPRRSCGSRTAVASTSSTSTSAASSSRPGSTRSRRTGAS